MQANVRMLRQPSWLGEFRAFVARGNVVDLAIGIIIGAAFTGVVGSLVKDVINPVTRCSTKGCFRRYLAIGAHSSEWPVSAA